MVLNFAYIAVMSNQIPKFLNILGFRTAVNCILGSVPTLQATEVLIAIHHFQNGFNALLRATTAYRHAICIIEYAASVTFKYS